MLTWLCNQTLEGRTTWKLSSWLEKALTAWWLCLSTRDLIAWVTRVDQVHHMYECRWSAYRQGPGAEHPALMVRVPTIEYVSTMGKNFMFMCTEVLKRYGILWNWLCLDFFIRRINFVFKIISISFQSAYKHLLLLIQNWLESNISTI